MKPLDPQVYERMKAESAGKEFSIPTVASKALIVGLGGTVLGLLDQILELMDEDDEHRVGLVLAQGTIAGYIVPLTSLLDSVVTLAHERAALKYGPEPKEKC